MSRIGLLSFVLVGCAKGVSALGGDGSVAIDAPPGSDAQETFVDAPPDARMIDAFVPPPDSPPDAFIPQPDAPPPPPDACVPVAQQRLVNPALDLTPQGVGWTDQRDPLTNMLPGGPFPIISANPTGLAAQSVPNKAWFGGAAGGDVTPPAASLTDQLFQDVTFPADATTFVVSGFLLVGTTEDTTDPTVFDTFSIDVTETNGTPIENVVVANNNTVANVFTPFSKTLASNLAGRTVRLRLISVNDDIFHTNFFIDTLSFTATFCP